MKLFRNWQNIPDDARGSVFAIGNFDGMHLGHQALLKEVFVIAKNQGRLSGLITFEPMTKSFFAKEGDPKNALMMGHNKVEFAKNLGLDLYVQLDFDRALSHYSGQEFIEKILIQGLGISNLIVGYDFVFGHQRSGNVDLLKSYRDFFQCHVVEKQEIETQKIGSSEIRKALAGGGIEIAKKLLGHEWILDVSVNAGGRVDFGEYLCPADGIYPVSYKIMEKTFETILFVKNGAGILENYSGELEKGFVRIIF